MRREPIRLLKIKNASVFLRDISPNCLFSQKNQKNPNEISVHSFMIRSNEPVDLDALPALNLSWDAARSPEAIEYRLQQDLMMHDAYQRLLEYYPLTPKQYAKNQENINKLRELAFYRAVGFHPQLADTLADGYVEDGPVRL